MIELSKPSLRLQWPLLFIIVILNAYVTAAQGAGLRDIRIGEYEQFTRVVFEFDAAVAPTGNYLACSGPSVGDLCGKRASADSKNT